MDRLSQPKLKVLETLTPADLPRLIENRDNAIAALNDVSWAWDAIVLHKRISWLEEQIGYCKMLERDGARK